MVSLKARPESLDIDLKQTAVIVVDIQNSFASKGGLFDLMGLDISGAAPAVDVNRRLLDAARASGVQIIYLRMNYKPDLSNAGGPVSPNYHRESALIMMRERPELDGKLLVEGQWDSEIVEQLTPQPGDMVISKPRFSGFCGTSLESDLRGRNKRYLLFTGIATNICVESTARDAYFCEFWPILVEDAMAHQGPDFCRQATIWNFETVFGWVTDSSAVIATFEAASS